MLAIVEKLEVKVARMKRSGIRVFCGSIIPDSAMLHPGYAGCIA
jgi:hypothetical protein